MHITDHGADDIDMYFRGGLLTARYYGGLVSGTFQQYDPEDDLVAIGTEHNGTVYVNLRDITWSGCLPPRMLIDSQASRELLRFVGPGGQRTVHKAISTRNIMVITYGPNGTRSANVLPSDMRGMMTEYTPAARPASKVIRSLDGGYACLLTATAGACYMHNGRAIIDRGIIVCSDHTDGREAVNATLREYLQ